MDSRRAIQDRWRALLQARLIAPVSGAACADGVPAAQGLITRKRQVAQSKARGVLVQPAHTL